MSNMQIYADLISALNAVEAAGGSHMIVIHADRPLIEVTLMDRVPTLVELQEAVGGYIETVPTRDLLAYCDEEGRIKGKPANSAATAFFRTALCGSVVWLRGFSIANSDFALKPEPPLVQNGSPAPEPQEPPKLFSAEMNVLDFDGEPSSFIYINLEQPLEQPFLLRLTAEDGDVMLAPSNIRALIEQLQAVYPLVKAEWEKLPQDRQAQHSTQ